MTRSQFARRLVTGAAAVGTLLTVAGGVVLADAWVALGTAPTGERAARMAASPQWSDGVFVNPEPMYNDVAGWFTGLSRASDHASPTAPLPVVTDDGSRFRDPPASGLRVTWLGHSTQLIEIDDHVVLTDPIFGERAGPVTWAGPKRWYAPPVPLDGLPELDAVVISHDHYDHLQLETIVALSDLAEARGWDTRFLVPLGVGAHLEYWGVDPARIVALDWWEGTTVGGLELVATPARHASGRQVLDQNRTLWAGWAILGPQHRAFFSGDTGLFSDLHRIGEELGPFDVTMIEVGAYDQTWPDWHIGPEQAVLAHQWLRGDVFLPVHWGLFDLALHGWTEPAERVLVAAERAGVTAAVPRPGESIEPATPPSPARWWPETPWQTAAEHPVVSTKVPDVLDSFVVELAGTGPAEETAD